MKPSMQMQSVYLYYIVRVKISFLLNIDFDEKLIPTTKGNILQRDLGNMWPLDVRIQSSLQGLLQQIPNDFELLRRLHFLVCLFSENTLYDDTNLPKRIEYDAKNFS